MPAPATSYTPGHLAHPFSAAAARTVAGRVSGVGQRENAVSLDPNGRPDTRGCDVPRAVSAAAGVRSGEHAAAAQDVFGEQPGYL